ncbi:MAG: hypothetical protein ACREC8_08755 [Limisphaerales bacterium]
MKMEMSNEKQLIKNAWLMDEPQHVLFAKTADQGMTIGVVTNSKPSSLALLAAGVVGMPARRTRRERTK